MPKNRMSRWNYIYKFQWSMKKKKKFTGVLSALTNKIARLISHSFLPL